MAPQDHLLPFNDIPVGCLQSDYIPVQIHQHESPLIRKPKRCGYIQSAIQPSTVLLLAESSDPDCYTPDYHVLGSLWPNQVDDLNKYNVIVFRKLGLVHSFRSHGVFTRDQHQEILREAIQCSKKLPDKADYCSLISHGYLTVQAPHRVLLLCKRVLQSLFHRQLSRCDSLGRNCCCDCAHC